MTHLLPLPTLHAAAPGVLEVVGGLDGDFDTAPIFHPPLWDGRRWLWDYDWSDAHERAFALALDCRLYSVRTRLIWLCSFHQDVDPEIEAADLAALTLALAPRIAALGR